MTQASEEAEAARGDYDTAQAIAQEYKAVQDQAAAIERILHPSDELVDKLIPLGFTSEQVATAYRNIGYESDEEKILSALVVDEDDKFTASADLCNPHDRCVLQRSVQAMIHDCTADHVCVP